ncbi:MAG: tyrosine-type recombinase/integrase [Chloroflexota bacterium]
MLNHNPYEVAIIDEVALSPAEFSELWAGAYESADEQLRVIWARLRDAWLRAKEKAGGSAHTRRAYEKASGEWMLFVSSIRVKGRPLQLWEVTTDHVRQWQEELSARLSAATVNQRLSACSSWYSFVINERGLVDGFEVSAFMDRSGKTRSNPFTTTTVPRDREQRYDKARVLKLEEIHQLLNYLERTKETAIGARNRALLLAYLMTGYRNTEIVGLRVGDIREHKSVPDAWVIRWTGKGGKTTTDPFPAKVVDAIQYYLTLADREPGQDEYIFQPIHTEQLAQLGVAHRVGQHLTDRSVRRILKSCLRRAGIDGWQTIRVHDLRHTFAHRFRVNNPDLEALRSRLHHESLATTGIYARQVLDEPVDDWSEGLF